jgi:diacylglycerol kinase family enzyme
VASVALASAAAAVGVMCAAVRVHPWSVLGILLALPTAVFAGWRVVSRRGLARTVAGLVLVVAVAAPVLHVLSHRPGALLVTMALLGLSVACARVALQPLGRRPRGNQHRPAHGRAAVRDAGAGRAVLLLNPRSGNGTAAAEVVDLAERSGVDLVMVAEGQDLLSLAEAALDAGASMLGVAGGDGSMAAGAGAASRAGVPFVCVPTGTRNHFARDLGIDPTDTATAMSAFRHGTEHRVDLADVNARVFVNNASLGLYAGLLASPHYRHSKLRAALDALPAMIGPESTPVALRIPAPDGTTLPAAHALLVSNNAYRLGGMGRGAWRPHLDSGLLGVMTVSAGSGVAVARMAAAELFGHDHPSVGIDRWTTDVLTVTTVTTVETDGAVDAALDGEAVRLEGLLRFSIRPGALLVRLPAVRPRSLARAVLAPARSLLRAARQTGPRQEPAQGGPPA